MIPGDGVRFYPSGRAICADHAPGAAQMPWCEGCHLGNHACGEASWCRHRLMARAAAAFLVLAYAIDPDHDLVVYRDRGDGYEPVGF